MASGLDKQFQHTWTSMSYTYYPITLRDGTYILKSLFCWRLVERVHGKKDPQWHLLNCLIFLSNCCVFLCESQWEVIVESKVKWSLTPCTLQLAVFFQVRMCKGCTPAFLVFNLLYCHHNCFIKLSLDNYLVLQKLYMYNLNSISVIVHTM